MAEIEMIKKGSTCKKQRVTAAGHTPVPPYAKLSVTQLAKLLKARPADVFAFLQGQLEI